MKPKISSTLLYVDTSLYHCRTEYEKREGNGSLWVSGIGLLITSAVVMSLTILMCVFLCLCQSNTNAKRMVKQVSSRDTIMTVYP